MNVDSQHHHKGFVFNLILITVSLVLMMVIFIGYYRINSQNQQSDYMISLNNRSIDTVSHSVDNIKYSTFAVINSNEIKWLMSDQELSNFEEVLAIRNLNALVSSNELIQSVEVVNTITGKVYSTNRGIIDKTAKDKKFTGLIPHFLELDEISYAFSLSPQSKQLAYINVYLNGQKVNQLLMNKGDFLFFADQNTTYPQVSEEKNQFFSNLVQTGELDTYKESNLIKKANPYVTYVSPLNAYLIQDPVNYSRPENLSLIKFSTIVMATIIVSYILLYFTNLIFLQRPLDLILNKVDIVRDEKSTIDEDLTYWLQNQNVKNESLNYLYKEKEVIDLLEGKLSAAELKSTYAIEWSKSLYLYLVQDRQKTSISLIEDQVNCAYEKINHGRDTLIIMNESILDLIADVLLDDLQIIYYENVKLKSLKQAYTSIIDTKDLLFLYPKIYLVKSHDFNKEIANPEEIQSLEDEIILGLKNLNGEAIEDSFSQWFNAIKQHRKSSIIMNYRQLNARISKVYEDDIQDKYFILADDLLNNLLQNVYDISIVNLYFKDLTSQYIRLYKEQEIKVEQEFVNEIKKYINNNFKSPNFSINDVASEFELSNNYINRRFREITHQSISNYINDLRLDSSVVLLLESDKTIKEISESVGILNSAYFSTLFKNKYNLTPSEFRKEKSI